MNTWYNSLSAREKTLVQVASIAILALLIWMLIIKPLFNNHKKLTKIINTQKITLAKMQKQSIEIKQLTQQQTNIPASNISANPQQSVERSLQTWRLKLSLERMQSQGNNGVRLVLKNTNADRFMRFLYELENKYALTISNLVINHTKRESGFVDVRLTVKRN